MNRDPNFWSCTHWRATRKPGPVSSPLTCSRELVPRLRCRTGRHSRARSTIGGVLSEPLPRKDKCRASEGKYGQTTSRLVQSGRLSPTALKVVVARSTRTENIDSQWKPSAVSGEPNPLKRHEGRAGSHLARGQEISAG